MRILGLDLGSKTLGVAISDKTAMIATGLTTIRFENDDNEKTLDHLRYIISEYNAELIVLGLPKNMNNTEGKAAQRSRNFKLLLEESFGLPVELQDERLSSVSANNVLLKADLSRKKRKEKVDAVAATIILQNYLDIRKEKENGK